MKTIPLEEAYKILENASAIIIDDSKLTYPWLSELKGEGSNLFLDFTYEEEGLVYDLMFVEDDNQEVKVSGSSIFLRELEQEDEDPRTKITILTTKELE
jgi:hypothetical protein